ncbi:hypothetical protein V3468_05980 [Flavobacterium oreochromis]|uniref:Lipoprotein n=1 Tax=Flavobacterium oreochromis TaxID=2906078 RepID=A0ABW8PCA7_9FLAO|nr:hypothetical protein [Flavobacterium oreochromis]OWP74017.1 hypothetical protein BWG23_15215 [Flavobacterium oreochromis]
MERKFIRLAKLLFIYLSILVIYQSCGYFENDSNEYQKTIVDNILIQKQENDKAINIVFKETDEIFAVITDDCLNIYYDANNKKIFVESYLTSQSSTYYEIKIINPKEKYISKGIIKKSISFEDFKEKTKELERGKIVFDE